MFNFLPLTFKSTIFKEGQDVGGVNVLIFECGFSNILLLILSDISMDHHVFCLVASQMAIFKLAHPHAICACFLLLVMPKICFLFLLSRDINHFQPGLPFKDQIPSNTMVL